MGTGARTGVVVGITCWMSVLGLASEGSAAAKFTKAAGASLVTAGATGIYSMANLNKDGKTYPTLALFSKGKMYEIHARNPLGQYLPKQAGSTSVKVVSSSAFASLITIAGGVNRNVEQLSQAKRDQFYQVAGLSASATTPREVPAGPGGCPSGYESHVTMTPTGKKITCRPLSEGPREIRQWLATRWERLVLVPAAEAATEDLKLVLFEFKLSNLFGDVAYEYNPQGNIVAFRGFGIVAIWTFVSGG